MNVEANTLTLVSACTALVASIAGPVVQLVIARRQIGANLISANRQKWIEALRDHVAEVISLLSTGAFVKLAIARKDSGVTPGNVALLDKIQRLLLVRNKIVLLINPGEADHKALLDAIERPFARLWQEGEPDVIAAVEADIAAITGHAQTILKREWIRVKRGE